MFTPQVGLSSLSAARAGMAKDAKRTAASRTVIAIRKVLLLERFTRLLLSVT